MTPYTQDIVLLPALALAASMLGVLGIYTLGNADDNPPANSTSGPGAPSELHRNPAWDACKKQADEQKLQTDDARHEFMKNCIKSARSAGTAPAAS